MDGVNYFINVCNLGTVTSPGGGAYAGIGGLVGSTKPEATPTEINIYNCFNLGTIGIQKSGGFLERVNATSINVYNSYNLVNMPDVNAGIIYVYENNNGNLTMNDVFYVSENYIYSKNENAIVTAENVKKISLQESKTTTFVDELNINTKNGYSYQKENADGEKETITIDTTGWAKWTSNIRYFNFMECYNKNLG